MQPSQPGSDSTLAELSPQPLDLLASCTVPGPQSQLTLPEAFNVHSIAAYTSELPSAPTERQPTAAQRSYDEDFSRMIALDVSSIKHYVKFSNLAENASTVALKITLQGKGTSTTSTAVVEYRMPK
jgi:hypothetical protein